MNKEDIKKALQICAELCPELCKRFDCPYYTHSEDCTNDILKDALNLITEQEQENEKQRQIIENLNGLIDYSDKEIRKLKADKQDLAKALKQSEDNYSRAFERLKTQQREIDTLKADNKIWSTQVYQAYDNGYKDGYDSTKEDIIQAKIDVLTELKEKYASSGSVGSGWATVIFVDNIDEMIEELKQ